MSNRMIGNLGFDEDVRLLFEESDRQCMASRGLDLWDWWEVRKRADAILNQVTTGGMPPGQPWTQDKILMFSEWKRDGMPKRRPSALSRFFVDIDQHTEFENPPGSGVMNQAITVMRNVLPAWKDFAEQTDPINAKEALEDLEAILLTAENREAVIAIDSMLCDVFDVHFRDATTGEVDNYAVLDAFENFGRDRFPEDNDRAQVPGHFDGGYHRMDSTSMWFNWAGQLECAHILGEASDKHDRRTSMMAGLILGCPMDFVFRVDAKGAQQGRANPRALTDPSYSRDVVTEESIRNKAKRSIGRWDRASERMKELYRYYAGITK